MTSKLDELILVVPARLITQPGWYGIRPVAPQPFAELVRSSGVFLRRGPLETDPSYKQINPYLIFRQGPRFFSGVRRSSTTEGRLAHLRWLGVGGHLNEADCTSGEILDWAQREWAEEVVYSGSITRRTLLGLINDDTNDVGRVHLGLAVLLDGDSAGIQLVHGENNERGELLMLAELAERAGEMETWGRICLEYLLNHDEV
jgi:predicted NUDIX family phosphoesterase